jgi:hypothetical protein
MGTPTFFPRCWVRPASVFHRSFRIWQIQHHDQAIDERDLVTDCAGSVSKQGLLRRGI